MNWNDRYPKGCPPDLESVSKYIENPLWEELCQYMEDTYHVMPKVEHSICSGAPGWNLKYKKSGRALCTLYPAQGFYTCLLSIGSKEAMEAEVLLGTCTEYLQTLYWNTKPFQGGRWLMIEVSSSDILEDVKALIALRVKKKRNPE